jgi:hypothetical protein
MKVENAKEWLELIEEHGFTLLVIVFVVVGVFCGR